MTSEPPALTLAETPALLIVLMGSLGDIVRALPLASVVKHHRPGARLSWVADWRWRELVEAHPGIDRVVVFPRERTPSAIAAFVRELRRERADITLDLQRLLKSGLCSRVSGAARRIGFDPANAKEFNHLFNTEYIGARPPRLPKWRHYLAFAGSLGLPPPDHLDFGLGRLADRRLLPAAVGPIAGRFVALVMGSSWPSKDWNLEGYLGLASLISRETTYRMVLLGDSSRQDLAARIAAGVRGPEVVNLAGRTSLTELGATLGAARAAIGPDTGPSHLAAALGTPYVTLFGPTEPERVAPYGCEHLAVRSPVDCEPCRRRRCRRREGRCLDAITPAMAWRALEPLL
ncbi:MAG: glycosyltransferase family 9 protein [Vicinamibacterales bacterium]